VSDPHRQDCSLPDAETVALCRGLGLAISNAAVYGNAHRVTAESVATVYARLVGAVDLYGDIELSSCDKGLLLNGQLADISRGMGQTLLDQMRRGEINSVRLCAPLDRAEFTRFIALLGDASPAGGSVADRIAASAFRSIRVDESVYARVAKDAGRKEIGGQAAAKTTAAQGVRRRGTGGKVFDLDSDLALTDDVTASDDAGMAYAADVLSAASTAADYTAQINTARQQRQDLIKIVARHAGDVAALDALHEQLRANGIAETEWQAIAREAGITATGTPDEGTTTQAVIHKLIEDAEALCHNRAATDPGDTQALNTLLESIDQEVRTLIEQTTTRTTSLAQRVDADRETVAEIESRARAGGIGLQLSREELLASLAEINQELVQPLTASNAMLQMLASGSIGDLSSQQQAIIQQTTEGLERLEKLIDYLQRISGLPTALTPDRELLAEIYKPS